MCVIVITIVFNYFSNHDIVAIVLVPIAIVIIMYLQQ